MRSCVSRVKRCVQVSFHRFPWLLYVTLLARLFLPTIYNNVRVAILGSLSNSTDAVKIVSQFTWVQTGLEVLEESLLLPLYHCLGSTIDDDAILRGRLRSGLNVCIVFYAVFCQIIVIITPQLVQAMSQSASLIPATSEYLRLEMASVFATGISKFADILLVVKKKTRMLFGKLVIEMICSIVLDVFFFSNFSISLKLGTRGVAYSSIARSCILLLLSLSLAFISVGMKFRHLFVLQPHEYSWLKTWSKQGLFSGLDSLIRNSVYILLVVRMMNVLGEQDTYWLANSFIWAWLLLPILALSELLKQDVSTRHPVDGYSEILPAYASLCLATITAWLITLPGWRLFIGSVLRQGERASAITLLVYRLMPGYLFFIVSSLARSIFYAKGKIQYIVMSAAGASVLLVVLSLLVIYKVLDRSLEVIANIFAGNMIFGSLLILFLVLVFTNRNGARIVENDVPSDDGLFSDDQKSD